MGRVVQSRAAPISAAPGAERPRLAIRAVEKRFNGKAALRGVDLELGGGSVTCIIGPSGSGKSTLLKCVNLLRLIDSGEIWYRDQLVVRARQCEALSPLQSVVHMVLYGNRRRLLIEREVRVTPHVYRQRVALVFQEFNLWPSSTVLQNLIEGPVHAKRTPRQVAEARARELLALVGLPDVFARYPNQLSGGQRQRVAIARALMMDADLLLLDEVTSALDPELVGEVLAVLRNLAERGVTMLVVTHHIDFAREIADRVVMLDDGQVIEAGTPREVLDQPRHSRTRRFLEALSEAR